MLGTAPIGKLLFKLAIPTVVAQLINMLYNIVDRIYIGHMPGDGSLALTGVGVCMPIIMIRSAFAALISSGGAQMALAQAGIKLYGGVSGDADEAVEAFISGCLDFDPDAKCDHHDHHHGEGQTCGDHGCGSNCGSHGCH